MIPGTKPLTPEDKRILEQDLKMTPRQFLPISDYFNPHSNLYWALNGAVLLGAVVGRHYATKIRAPRLLWGTLILSLPFYGFMSTIKLDKLNEKLGHRLDYSPMTRRAWNRAVEANNEYQNDLRKQIDALKALQK